MQLSAVNIPGIDYPLTAQCAISWEMPSTDCKTVKAKLIDQIKLWNMDYDCNGSQRCLYEMKGQTENGITAKHTTPKKRYVDSLTFTFKSNGAGCNVEVIIMKSKSDFFIHNFFLFNF